MSSFEVTPKPFKARPMPNFDKVSIPIRERSSSKRNRSRSINSNSKNAEEKTKGFEKPKSLRQPSIPVRERRPMASKRIEPPPKPVKDPIKPFKARPMPKFMSSSVNHQRSKTNANSPPNNGKGKKGENSTEESVTPNLRQRDERKPNSSFPPAKSKVEKPNGESLSPAKNVKQNTPTKTCHSSSSPPNNKKNVKNMKGEKPNRESLSPAKNVKQSTPTKTYQPSSSSPNSNKNVQNNKGEKPIGEPSTITKGECMIIPHSSDANHHHPMAELTNTVMDVYYGISSSTSSPTAKSASASAAADGVSATDL